jgi:hypothetical protein
MTADGQVHTRTTARTYTHVLVGRRANQESGVITVTNWVGRPDLVAGKLASEQRTGWWKDLVAEPINNGVRS